MKCNSQPAFLENRPTKIHDIWEVRISESIWKRIRATSLKYSVSFTCVTRYCTFRLGEKGNHLRTDKFGRVLSQLRSSHNGNQALHRHMACFYGEDVKLVRLAAMEMGVSVSMFIRLALVLYLPRFEMEIHSRKAVTPAELFWRGIKRWIEIAQLKINNFSMPTYRHFTFSSFPPDNWWGHFAPKDPVAFSF